MNSQVAFANKVRQANSGFKHFQLKQQIIIFERCVFKMYWRWSRDERSERDRAWRWRVNHTQKYSWKIKFSLTTSIFSDCLICNITSVLRLALLAFASYFFNFLIGIVWLGCEKVRIINNSFSLSIQLHACLFKSCFWFFFRLSFLMQCRCFFFGFSFLYHHSDRCRWDLA